MKNIKKIAPAKFRINKPNVENSEIILDFNPIIAQFELSKSLIDYHLIHWQGRPKGDREWGIYDPKNDNYYCGIYGDCPTFYGGMKLLMLDDKTAATLPSAAL
jgi:hypothetical protein